MRTDGREFLLYLEDMMESMIRIEEYLENLSFRQFIMNQLIVDATIRNFEIIGEASKNVPASIQNKYPEVPWKKMYGLRNLISHEYFGIDYEMIWEIAKNNLPQNRIDLAKILIKEKSERGKNAQI